MPDVFTRSDDTVSRSEVMTLEFEQKFYTSTHLQQKVRKKLCAQLTSDVTTNPSGSFLFPNSSLLCSVWGYSY